MCTTKTTYTTSPLQLGEPAVAEELPELRVSAFLPGKHRGSLRRHERRFNVVGPNHVELHYTIPPERRLVEVETLCRQGEYVVVLAPRMSGKTTWSRAFARTLAGDGSFAVLRVSLRSLGRPGLGVPEAQGEMLDLFDHHAEEQLPPPLRPAPRPPTYEVRFVGPVLSAWARVCPKPIVLVLDDIDDVEAPIVTSLLSQLRASHAARPRAAPWSVVITSAEDLASRLDVAETRALSDFTLAEIATLCAEYTEETGQPFTDKALERLAALSGGHPWVVNAIARETVERVRPPRKKPITEEHVSEAQRRLLAC